MHVAKDGNVSVVAILFKYGNPDPVVSKVNFRIKPKKNKGKKRENGSLLSSGMEKTTDFRSATHLQIQNKLNALLCKAKIQDNAPIVLGHFHFTELSKRSRKYYRYVGSYTNPPCTENVIWHVLGKVKDTIFRTISHSSNSFAILVWIFCMTQLDTLSNQNTSYRKWNRSYHKIIWGWLQFIDAKPKKYKQVRSWMIHEWCNINIDIDMHKQLSCQLIVLEWLKVRSQRFLVECLCPHYYQ